MTCRDWRRSAPTAMRMTTVMGAMLSFAVSLAGCPKSESSNKGAPAPSASAAPSAAASAEPPATTADAGSTSSAIAGTFLGTYTLAPHAVYIPDSKDWDRVKQAKDDPSKHVGEGAVTLTVDGAGHITGSIDTGPAAPGVIDGSLVDGELRGGIRRKDPTDDGLTGTFIAGIAGDSVTGTLSLAEANAAIVREGKLTLKKK